MGQFAFTKRCACGKILINNTMDFFGFNIQDGKEAPIEAGEVFFSDCWDGCEGNHKCRIMAGVNKGLREKAVEHILLYTNQLDKIDALVAMLTDESRKYDYDIVFPDVPREKHDVEIGSLKFQTPSITLREGFYDPEGGYDLQGKRKRESPTFWLLERGQCVTTSNEVARVLRANGMNVEMVSSMGHCLNIFKQELQLIPHVYNKIKLPSGKEITLDICALQMQLDAERKGFDINTTLLHKKNGIERPFVL